MPATAPWTGLDGALLFQCRGGCVRGLSSKGIRVARGDDGVAGEVMQDVLDLHAQ